MEVIGELDFADACRYLRYQKVVSTITKHDDVGFAVSESNLLVVGVLHKGLQYRLYIVLRAVCR